jgi:hypothetical protein
VLADARAHFLEVGEREREGFSSLGHGSAQVWSTAKLGSRRRRVERITGVRSSLARNRARA